MTALPPRGAEVDLDWLTQGQELAPTDAGFALELALPCRVNDPDLWFADTPAELEQAKVLCASCPVATECLAGALTRGEPWGVWGGEILEQGVVIARKRSRGRPRKTSLVGASA